MQKNSSINPSIYRADIDGLRAVAIISVLLFHFFPETLGSGFIGVDIFFVISGFLISSIILNDLKKEQFNFKHFYSKRIKRIFPALLVVVSFSLIVGYLMLYPDEYKQLAKHTIGASTFINNVMLWRESGYFDNASDTKPLLHLWSLGIEEQFYVIWPIILLLIWKKQYSFIFLSLLFILISFFLNIYFVSSHPSATFFLPFTRVWELLIGFVVAYLLFIKNKDIENIRYKYSKILSIIGLSLLIIGFIIISKNNLFPSWFALLPTFGAALIIFSNDKSWFNKYVLSQKLFVMIGLISYPLYLWHYPLLVFTRIITNDTASDILKIIILLISVLLAWITYQFIEKPIRFKKKNSVTILIFGMFMVFLIGVYIFTQNGLRDRSFVQNNITLESGNDGGTEIGLIRECGLSKNNVTFTYDKPFRLCFKDSRENIKYALIGDSKAQALFDGLVRTSTNKGRWLGIGGNSTSGDINSNLKHSKLYNIAIESLLINKEIKTVILSSAVYKLFELKTNRHIDNLPLSNNYENAKKGLLLQINKLIKAGKKVVLVVDNPTLAEPRDCVIRKSRLSLFTNDNGILKLPKGCSVSIKKHMKLSEQYLNLLNEIQNTNPQKIAIFDTLNYLCDTDNGVCNISKNGRMLYSYSNHISDYAAGLIGKDLNKFLNNY